VAGDGCMQVIDAVPTAVMFAHPTLVEARTGYQQLPMPDHSAFHSVLVLSLPAKLLASDRHPC